MASPTASACFVIPNDHVDESTPLESFLVPTEVVERVAGFKIFPHLKGRSGLCQQVSCKLPEPWKPYPNSHTGPATSAPAK